MVTLYFIKPNGKTVPLRATKACGEVAVKLGTRGKYVVIFMLQQLQGNSLF
jgi:hypothetical protein